MSDPSLLALVVDDPLAAKVLAYWKAKKTLLHKSEHLVSHIAAIVQAPEIRDVRRTLERLTLAGMIVDGGISDIADSWLTAHVAKRVGIKPKKSK